MGGWGTKTASRRSGSTLHLAVERGKSCCSETECSQLKQRYVGGRTRTRGRRSGVDRRENRSMLWSAPAARADGACVDLYDDHDYKRNGTLDLFAALTWLRGGAARRPPPTPAVTTAVLRWIDVHVDPDPESRHSATGGPQETAAATGWPTRNADAGICTYRSARHGSTSSSVVAVLGRKALTDTSFTSVAEPKPDRRRVSPWNDNPSLRLDQTRRRDSRQSRPRTSHPRPDHQIRDHTRRPRAGVCAADPRAWPGSWIRSPPGWPMHPNRSGRTRRTRGTTQRRVRCSARDGAAGGARLSRPRGHARGRDRRHRRRIALRLADDRHGREPHGRHRRGARAGHRLLGAEQVHREHGPAARRATETRRYGPHARCGPTTRQHRRHICCNCDQSPTFPCSRRPRAAV